MGSRVSWLVCRLLIFYRKTGRREGFLFRATLPTLDVTSRALLAPWVLTLVASRIGRVSLRRRDLHEVKTRSSAPRDDAFWQNAPEPGANERARGCLARLAKKKKTFPSSRLPIFRLKIAPESFQASRSAKRNAAHEGRPTRKLGDNAEPNRTGLGTAAHSESSSTR